MDELRECPWCWSKDVGLYKAHAASYPPSVLCHACGRAVEAEDAVAAWNALPRKTGWMVYDGKGNTLPEPGRMVIVEIEATPNPRKRTFQTVACLSEKCLDNSFWWERAFAEPWKASVGDRWMPWPGEK